MKHDRLCAIGHNLADSLASGLCFVIGMWDTDIFGEAAAGDGVIEVDFLHGRVTSGKCSNNLHAAVKCFGEVLPEFCRANQAAVGDFSALTARFYSTSPDYRVSVTVRDARGKSTVTDYHGLPLKRLKVLDALGRVRRATRTTVRA